MPPPALRPNTTARLTHEAGLADQLCSALAGATNGEVLDRRVEVPMDDKHRLDLVFTLAAGGESVEVAVETLRHAYPRDIRQAVWQLEEYKLANSRPQGLITMVAAESLSLGAKELLRKRGVGYFERSGSLHLRWRQWLIDIERLGKATGRTGSLALFTDARAMVVHALLQHRGEWLTGGELAELAQTSAYTCSVVLQELSRLEWCESRGAGRTLRRRLAQPALLLDAWAEQWPQRKETRSRWYVLPRQPQGLLTQLTYQIEQQKLNMPWAFTGTAAANVYAPLLTSVDTAEIIVSPGQAEPMAQALGLKPADQGGNVTLMEREGASLLFRTLHPEYPSWFASPFILYLDLLDGRGRNKELAQHVRNKLELL